MCRLCKDRPLTLQQLTHEVQDEYVQAQGRPRNEGQHVLQVGGHFSLRKEVSFEILGLLVNHALGLALTSYHQLLRDLTKSARLSTSPSFAPTIALATASTATSLKWLALAPNSSKVFAKPTTDLTWSPSSFTTWSPIACCRPLTETHCPAGAPTSTS